MDRSEQDLLLERERNIRPNLSVARAMLCLPVIISAVAVMALLGIYEAVDGRTLVISMTITIAASITPVLTLVRPDVRRHPATKNVLLLSMLLMVLVVSIVLNVHVTLMLILPLLLSAFYGQPRITAYTWVFSALICLLSAPVSYLLNTYSLLYLEGYISALCRVTITVCPVLEPDLWGDLERILLFLTLPQLMLLSALGIGFYAMAKSGEASLKHQLQIIREHTVDSLTGLYTPEFFYRSAAQLMKEQAPQPAVLVVCDIDHLKMYNDIFGHEAGDLLLKETARVLSEYAGKEGICGRLGQDHLALYMPEALFSRQEYIRRVLQHSGLEQGNYRVKLHAGLCPAADCNTEIRILCDRALTACHTDRQDVQKLLTVYDEEIHLQAERRQWLMGELEQAIARDEFVPYLQPQCDTEGSVIGAEALVRWVHPQRGIQSPATFIELCEQSGLITRLDLLMWEKVCRLLKRWQQEGRPALPLSVNISQIDLYRMDVCARLTELTERYGVDRRLLKLQITETAMMKDVDRQRQIISRLRQAGFCVQMDDFGSGSSSLSILQQLKVDALKLDVGFIRTTLSGENGARVLQHVVLMAGDLNADLVVEGVETLSQLQLLQQLGCTVFQGYYFARPMPVSEFEQRYFFSGT